MSKTPQQLAQQLLELLNTQPLAKINQSNQSVEIYNNCILIGSINLNISRYLSKSNSSYK
jgi:hypothetical protein